MNKEEQLNREMNKEEQLNVEEESREMNDVDKHIEELIASSDEFRRVWEEKKPQRLLATQVLQRRSELGLSQRDLAERMGTSQNQVYLLESGQGNPTLETVHKLTDLFGGYIDIHLVEEPSEVESYSDLQNVWTEFSKLVELQQRNAQFFQSWMTGGVDYLRNQAEHNQKAAETFAKSAREQQERLRKLGEDYFGLYEEMAQSSRSYAEEGMRNAQQATRQGLQAVQETAEQADQMARQADRMARQAASNGEMPIQDYDSLSVNDVAQKLGGLSEEDLKKVRSYEKQNKNRDSLVEQIDRKINKSA